MCSVASVEVAQVQAPDLARHLHLVRLESAGDAGFHHRRARDLWPPNGGVVFFLWSETQERSERRILRCSLLFWSFSSNERGKRSQKLCTENKWSSSRCHLRLYHRIILRSCEMFVIFQHVCTMSITFRAKCLPNVTRGQRFYKFEY